MSSLIVTPIAFLPFPTGCSVTRCCARSVNQNTPLSGETERVALTGDPTAFEHISSADASLSGESRFAHVLAISGGEGKSCRQPIG